MTTMSRLSDLIEVRSRFTRSVNLERDFEVEIAQDGYVITSLARSTLQRIAEGLRSPNGTRAWTLTGPYGSGKSAFALYLAGLLSLPNCKLNGPTRSHLQAAEPQLWKELFDPQSPSTLDQCKLLPVLITGSRESVRASVASGFVRTLQKYPTNKALELAKEFQDYLRLPAQQQMDRPLLVLVERVGKEVLASWRATGLLIILDELGKYLEQAALSPATGDLLFLQSLAELADPKRSKTPILFITLLHQSFDRYAERLTALERSEWSKVQGRFEDVAFQESYEQNVRLIANALERKGQGANLLPLATVGNSLAAEAQSLSLRPPGLGESEFTQLLERCSPLHPLVALLLGPLFRKLAQNERSLFAFLSSKEPFGFQDFLHSTGADTKDHPVYTLPQLYDYLSASVGANLYASASGARWAEIETALDRLGASAEESEKSTVKAVGILTMVGNLGLLKPDLNVLAFAVGKSRDEMQTLLRKLCDQSILIYRNFKSSYALWDGSDFDLEAHLQDARDLLGRGETLAELLSQERPIRPLVARRHSTQFGLLRYFNVQYWDLESVPENPDIELGDADGLLVLLLGGRPDEEKTDRLLKNLAPNNRILLGIPEATRILQGYLLDLKCLRHVLQTRPELAGDAVARREIRTRIQDTQQALQAQMDSLLDQVTADGHWYHVGQPIAVISRRNLTEQLSTICDRVYPQTPTIRNEMVYRRVLTSACSAARNSLIGAMLQRGFQALLGIEGHPLERSLYDALLAGPGIHREEDGIWGFHPPRPGHPDRIDGIWAAFWLRLEVSEMTRTSVDELFESVRVAPYGVKDGPLPILLCAFLLAHDSELAMYEEGAFVPQMTTAHYERLVRTPARFQIQRYRVEGARGQVFARLAAAYSGKPQEERLLTLVKPMFALVGNLVPYAKVTKNLPDPTAIEVRRALLDATDPVRLLFETLPIAVGQKPFGSDETDGSDPQVFVQVLQQRLRELQNAYPSLLKRVETNLFDALGTKARGESARDELVNRSRNLLKMQLDESVLGVLVRMSDDKVDHQPWIESMATVLSNKPPKHWVDKDEGAFLTSLREFQRRFRQLEALSLELGTDVDSGGAYCLGIVAPGQAPREQVVRLKNGEEKEFEALKQALMERCSAPGTRLSREGKLMALAEVALRLFDQERVIGEQLGLGLEGET